MKTRVLIAALAACLSSSLFAQVAGTITGSVKDATGASVPSAKIEVFLAGGTKAVLASAVTSDGFFTISGVRPETYQIKVAAAGFTTYTINNVKVDPAQETQLPPIKLQVGAVSASVEVTTTNEGVQTTNVETTRNVSIESVEDLPVVNRSPLTLVGTQAGVLSTGSDTTTINGQRTSFTNVTMNGVNIQDNFIRTNALDFLPNELLSSQVSEFTVTTSNQDASQSAASSVSFVSPSGSNSTHGSAIWSNRNDFLAANSWFNNQAGVSRSFLNQNQYAGTLGGHIIKDRWFYYGAYEGFRLRQTAPITDTILTDSARNGIFTYRDGNGNVQQANVLTLAGATINSAIAPILAQVPDGNKINNFNVGDSSATLSRNTGGYRFNGRDDRTRDNVTGTTDYIISSRQSLSASFNFNRDIDDRPDLQNNYALAPNVTNSDYTYFLSAAYRATITPSLTNELRGGFDFAPANFITDQQFGTGIIDGFLFNNPLNTFRAQGRQTNTYALNDNATWAKGKHFIKFGFGYQAIRTAPFNDAGITPTYTIGIGTGHTGLVAAQLPGISATDLATANSLLASLEGAVTSASQTYNITSQNSGFVNGATNLRHLSFDNYNFYIQDNWKVLRNFTIEAGLRYDYYAPLREANNLELQAQIENNNIQQTLLDPAGTFNFVKGGFYNPDRTDFGPRLGFAWDVFGDGKTSVRGGYGLYYVNDELVSSANNSLTTNPGLSFTSAPTGLSTFANNVAPVQAPAYLVPRNSLENYALNTANAIGIINPNLKTPYVAQYSLSIQREFKKTIFSVSYIGNHGTKLLRGVDFNQVNIKQNGFLGDFQRAESNGYLALATTGKFTPTYNAGIAGSQPLTVFPTLASGGLLTNATVLSDIQTGQVGQLAALYQQNGLNGPVNFFANPSALGANYTSNDGDSTYNSLQIDARHRYSNGLSWQANYVYSKVLSDTLGDSQTNFEPLLDNNNPQAERAPAPFDLRNIFKANGIYDLPVGPGHHFNPKYVGRVIGGWTVGSTLTWQSGTPFNITSGARGTLNRAARSTYNTATALVNGSALFKDVSFRQTPTGPYFIASSAIGPDGRGTAPDGSAPFAGQVFANPVAGDIGDLQRREFYGPNAFNQNLSILKNIKILERQTLQIRGEATNVWNHSTFFVGDQSIDSTTFGKITSSFFGARLVQLTVTYKF